ncbi:MAG: hypothetical protein JXR84_06695 [Anaerolineae bacterium]|nr:hypothetical protein [Anaerolineae bacterium]
MTAESDQVENQDLPEIEKHISALKNQDNYIRADAIIALAKYGETASEPLIRSIKQEYGDYGVRQIAATVLSKVNEPWMEECLAAARAEKWYIDKLQKEFNQPAASPLIGKMPPSAIRHSMVEMLDKELGSMPAALIVAMKTDLENAPSVANKALAGLGWDGDMEAIATMIPQAIPEKPRKGNRPWVILLLILLILFICFGLPALIFLL